jgi:DedD protein
MPAPAVATVAQLPAPPQAPQLLQAAAALPVAGSSFAVQLGSFANRRNADNLLHQLKAKGYAVYESNEGAGKNARYRVRVGPLSDRDAAETTIRKLKAEGHDSTLIAP